MQEHYSYPLYRPPAEANSIIVQVTNGCSYNKCTFCSMYVNKQYSINNLDIIYQQIDGFICLLGVEAEYPSHFHADKRSGKHP
jgi:uncharacterized Fe-S cluster-containing MiaB family protein